MFYAFPNNMYWQHPNKIFKHVYIMYTKYFFISNNVPYFIMCAPLVSFICALPCKEKIYDEQWTLEKSNGACYARQ